MNNSDEIKVIAIVVTYNGSRWIEKCLASLKESTQSVHTIVIDNASKDNTVEIIREKFPEVELIASKKNLGFGQANNVGLKKALNAKADFVFLLNQDAWIDKETVENLTIASVKNPDYGVLSPFHLNYEGSELELYFRDYVIDQYTSDYSDQAIYSDKNLFESSFIHAAAWLLPLDTIKCVGGFDPLFFHYGEDVDYVQRLHQKKLKIGFLTNAVVYHDAQNPSLKNKEINLRQKRNELIISLKNLKGSLPGVVFLFFKGLTAQLFSAKDYKTTYLDVAGILPAILRSRIKQKKELAYLNL